MNIPADLGKVFATLCLFDNTETMQGKSTIDEIDMYQENELVPLQLQENSLQKKVRV